MHPFRVVLPRRLIWNYDHTGFNYEIANKRTLSFIGERDTVLSINSKHKTSHSYSSIPVISREGSKIGKLTLCFAEPTGHFPPTLVEDIHELARSFRNIKVVASKSGKFDKALMDEFVRDVIIPAKERQLTLVNGSTVISEGSTIILGLEDEVSAQGYEIDDEDRECYDEVTSEESRGCWDLPFVQRCARNANSAARERCLQKPDVLLIADSWRGQTSEEYRNRLAALRIKLILLPDSTTDQLQPVDLNFNRQYKKFIKRILEGAIYDRILDNVTSRAGIMNMHSLAWNQLSSPAYRDMIRHAWHNTDPDYSIDELQSRPPGRMVQEIQYGFDHSDNCQHHTGCDRHAFIRCAHCGKLLCLHHFLERSCFHDHPATTDPRPPITTDSSSQHSDRPTNSSSQHSDNSIVPTSPPESHDDLRKES